MVWQVFVSFVGFLVLLWIGLGPLLWIGRTGTPTGGVSGGLQLACAPALGLAIVAFISHPLYRYVAPADEFGWPVLTGLLIGSGGVIFSSRVRLAHFFDKDALGLLFLLTIVWGALAVIPFAKGYELILFGINPSDDLMYLTIAESVQGVPWEVLTKGYRLVSSPESAAIIANSPSGMYGARMVANLPIRMATIVDVAWYSHVAGISLDRVLYSFGMCLKLVLTAMVYGIALVAGTGRKIAILIGVTAVFSFWAAMILAHDSYSQLQLLPVLGLILLAWHMGETGAWPRTAAFSVAALSYAAATVIYIELTYGLLAFVFALGMVVWWCRGSFQRAAGMTAAVVGGGMALLLASGQLVHFFQLLLRQSTFVLAREGTSGSNLLEPYFRSSILDSVNGTWWIRELLQSVLGISSGAGSLISLLIALISLAALVVVLWFVMIRRNQLAISAGLGYLAILALSYAILFYKNDTYAFLKMYAGPFAFGLIVAGVAVALAPRGTRTGRAVAFSGMFLIGLQLAYGAYNYNLDVRYGGADYLKKSKAGAYPIDRITAALDKAGVRNLVVYVPPREHRNWWHSAYLMLALKKYSPFQQSGYLMDNNERRLFHTFFHPPKRPEYLLISNADDYLAGTGQGRLIWEISGLRLYWVFGVDPSRFSYIQKNFGG